jgi:uncharacterized protein involved in outer membrane biogenesis
MKPAVRRVLTSKYFCIPVGALLFYTLVGFVVAPFIVRWYVPKYVREGLQCRAALSEVRMNPFLLTFEARGFELKQADGSPVASFERFFADLEWKSLVRWTAIFRDFRLENPVVHAIIEPDGGLNLQALAPKAQEIKEAEKPDSKPFRLLLRDIAVLGGKVAVIDRRQSEPAELLVEMFDLRFKDLSTLQGHDGTYRFTSITPEGERFEWQGEITLAPFRSNGKITIGGLKTATLWQFIRDTLNLEPPGGLLDVSVEYRFDASCSPTLCVLERLRLGISDLSLKLADSARPFLEWKQLEVDAPSFDLVERNLQVGKILLDGCALDIRLDPSGRLNLQGIVREKSSKQEQPEKTPAPEGQPAPSPGPAAPAEVGSPFRMNADGVEIKGMSVAFEDASPTTPSKGACSKIDLNFKASMGSTAQESPNAADDGPTEAKSSPSGLTIEGIALSLGDLFLKPADSEKALLELKKVELDVPFIDLKEKSVQLARLLVDGGAMDVRVDPSGLTNLERFARGLARQQSSEEKKTPSEAPTESPSQVAGSAPSDTPFKVKADGVEIKGFAFDFSDSSRAAPVKARCADIGLRFGASIQAGAGNPAGNVSNISSELKEIQLSDTVSSEPLFRTGKLTVEGGECDLGARSVVLPRIALSDGHADVSRDKEGRINWTQLLAARDAAEEKPASPPPSHSESSWKVLVKSLEVDGFRSKISDLMSQPEKPLFDVHGFKARVSDLDLVSPLGFAVDFQLEQGGSVSVSGRVDLKAPAVEAQVNVADLTLTPLQPYLQPFVTLVMRSAAVSTQGKLTYAVPGSGANLAYDGSFKLNKLKLTEPDSDQTYLGLGTMQIPKLKLTLEPDRFEAGEVKLSGLVGELIIAEDKTINLTRVVKKQDGGDRPPAAPQQEAKGGEEGFPFRIGKIQVEDGNVLFADLSLTPKFNARIHELKGFVTGLSSARDSRAKIQLDGRVDRFGVAKINGVMQVYDFQRSTEIDMVFRNVEMTSLSPYSGKFAGRQIKSGRLSTDLKYHIENRRLVGDNKIIVDNLVLGEHVDSPDAVNLPLDLAIALLKDSEGRINLGLPVTGDLDNPEFSIGPVIWKAFVSLITRAVTAPFRALGSLFGGKGEELNAIDFEPGSAEIPPPEREKLQKLAGGLLKRPELKLIVQGRYSPEADGTALKDLSVRRTVVKRLGTDLKPEEDPGPLDLTDSKTRKMLEELFEERFGEKALGELDEGIQSGAVKPRAPEIRQPDESKRKKKGFFSRMANNLKLYKVVPGGKSPEEAVVWSGELYLRLVESEPLAEEVLLKLADQRAQAVGEELERAGKVPANRVTLEKPEPDDTGPSVKLSLGAV